MRLSVFDGSVLRPLRIFVVALVLLAGLSLQVSAAPAGTSIKGRLIDALTGAVIPDAVVEIQETRQRATSTAEGWFEFEVVRPGLYHLLVRAEGYSERRTEVRVGQADVTVDLTVDPQLHYTEVVSVSAEPRNNFESYQATTVLAGQDLSRELEASLGATIQSQPGIAVRGLGPGPARPVIRGLDGDRVLLLEDGQRMGDLSSQSADHGLTGNPAAATRIEIVRGPASLLYGTSAVGGLVNVISETIPTRPVKGTSGGFTTELGSNAPEGSTAADLRWGNGTWTLGVGGGGRKQGDFRDAEGRIDNSQSRSGFGSVSAGWASARGYAGGSYAYEDTRYGIPFVESGQVELTPRRHVLNARAGLNDLHGPFKSLRFSLGHRRYAHEELVAKVVGTSFRNDSTEAELAASHSWGNHLSGTVGGWFLDRHFKATGDEALSPPVRQNGAAAFLFQEAAWPHVTLQAGLRVDHARFRPEGSLRDRQFTDLSGSVGLLFTPRVLRDRMRIAVSLARTARHPALEELYFFGPHPGNFAFEIGNADLDSEKALGFDISLRWRSARWASEVTYFRNSIDGYISRQPIAREDVPHLGEAGHGHGEEFPAIRFTAADSVLQGVEAHADVRLVDRLFAEFGFDYVHGEITTSDTPLPRIPPMRFRGGLRYQVNAFQVGGEVNLIGQQDRVFNTETTTDGYTLVKAFAAYSFQSGPMLHTLTARLDNATNTLYRNHLSLIKDNVAERGRAARLIYSLKF